MDRAREGGTLVTCINSPTPGQEKSKAQFRGPGERGRNSSCRVAVPPGANSTVVSLHQNVEGELAGAAAVEGIEIMLSLVTSRI